MFVKSIVILALFASLLICSQDYEDACDSAFTSDEYTVIVSYTSFFLASSSFRQEMEVK